MERGGTAWNASTDTCSCTLTIEGRNAAVLVDTGSSVTLARKSLVSSSLVQTRPPRSCLKSASGHEIPVTHEALLEYELGGYKIQHWTFICPDLMHEALIGYDFIKDHGLVIDGKAQTICCKNGKKIPIMKEHHALEVAIVASPMKEPTEPAASHLKPVTTTTAKAVEPIGHNTQNERQPAADQVNSMPNSERGGAGKREKQEIWTAEELDMGVLNPEQREALIKMVQQHQDCFSWDGSLGTCTLIEHQIELTSTQPVRRSAYTHSHHAREIIEREVREMHEKGLIEPSVSAYAAGVVLVPKKNGETRFCVDYRGLNAITKPDNYPLPLTRSEIFDTIGGAKIFSCLDCQQGYWQVKMAEEDQHKTAFRCHLGLWQWKVMSFGLRNAPATYQRLMSHVLSGYIGRFCHVFIDDIICFSRTFEEHLEHLRLIFERLEKANIKLKPSKCAFAKAEVKYLGHLLSPGEIRPDPSNVEKIQNLTPPTDVTGVRSFHGLASYYRAFLRDFSQRARPLTELTKKTVEFHWGEEEQKAFDDLKTALVSEPVLALPDFTRSFILMTDGSSTGLGAVLAQQHGDGRERVIAYASKKTGPLERNYSACESECLALVWATRHFRDYILGRTTTVITDHWALKWLQELQNASPRLQRWRLALQEYDLHIVHKAGVRHRNADFFSRMHEHFTEGSTSPAEDMDPHEDQPQPNQHGDTITNVACEVIKEPTRPGMAKNLGGPSNSIGSCDSHQGRDHSAGPLSVMNTEQTRISQPRYGRRILYEAQQKDKDCQEIVQSLETGSAPKTWHRDYTFRIAPDGILEEVSCDLTGAAIYKTVLPQTLIRQAVEDAHAGHLKTKKTLDKLRATYFFKRMYTVCHNYVQGCPTCQEKDRGPKYRAPLGDMPEPLGAWHTVAVDVLGPLPQTRAGKKYIIVITDYLTKYVLAIATKDQTAETTAAVLMEKFLEYGLPERLITDNGSNFRSRLVNELCRLLKISHLFTTPYHPQFDGLCERYNRTLAAMLRAFVAENQTDWDKYLPYVMHAYRAAPQESTKESPFFLMFFRPCRAPLDIMLADTERRRPSDEEAEVAKVDTVRRLQEAFRVVKQRLRRAREQQKKAHDKKSKPSTFQVGDEVYLLDERVPEGATRKLRRPWRPGYRIIRQTGPLNYIIEHPDRRGRELRVHVERLKAAIPELVWPEEPPPELNQIPVSRQPLPTLDLWLEMERRRYKPLRPDMNWMDDDDEDLVANPGTAAQEEPTQETSQREPGRATHTRREGSREQHREPIPGLDGGGPLPRRSERIRARQVAQEARN